MTLSPILPHFKISELSNRWYAIDSSLFLIIDARSAALRSLSQNGSVFLESPQWPNGLFICSSFWMAFYSRRLSVWEPTPPICAHPDFSFQKRTCLVICCAMCRGICHTMSCVVLLVVSLVIRHVRNLNFRSNLTLKKCFISFQLCRMGFDYGKTRTI